ncbi:hypothetical protein B0E55_05451 [Rhodococcus sp. 66b]|nr:hypothetical protein B0E55_05451 [Rhodococcus sp. 66b]
MRAEKGTVDCRISCHVGDQTILTYDGGGRENSRQFQQDPIDFSEFQALPAKLHLEVGTTQILDLTGGVPHDEVAGPIHPAGTEGVGYETICCQVRALHVAAGELDSREIEFSRHSDRARREAVVQHIGLRVPDRSADRHRTCCGGIRLVESDVDGSFGGTVKIVQTCTESFVEANDRRTRKCLAAGEHLTNGSTLCEIAVDEEDVEHRRDEVQGGDTFASDQLGEVPRIAMSIGFCNYQSRAGDEWPEQLPHRDVEGGGCLVQHDVVTAERIFMLHPQQAIDYRSMRHCNALGLSGGPGCEDHIGNVIRRYTTETLDVCEPLGGVPRKIDLVEKYGVDPIWQRCGVGRDRQDDRRCSDVEHVPDPLVRMLRIDRKIRTAGCDDGVHCHHVLRAPVQSDRDQ